MKTELEASEAEALAALRFCLYGTKPPGQDHTSFEEMLNSGAGFVIRAEESGCEGCYIEVARWNDVRFRYVSVRKVPSNL